MQRTITTQTMTAAAVTVLLPTLLLAAPAAARDKMARPKAPMQKPARAASPDPRTVAILKRVQAAYRRATTLSADFTYTVTSAKRQQVVEGRVLLKKPNLARVTFSYLREPAFPSLVASDGERFYTFTPESFDTITREFTAMPFDPRVGARQASGLLPGGGTIAESPVTPSGDNLRLWDATPVQAFFNPLSAIQRTLFIDDPNLLTYEGKQTLNGVTYRVLRHYFPGGNIAGGEDSPFNQWLYVGPDDLIHQYVLEFVSAGKPGVQVARLTNIRTNRPMPKSTFAFTPPGQKR